MITPFKYAGSKLRELKILEKWIPRGSMIVEPFGGTGVVTQHFGWQDGNEWNDTNKDLYQLLLFMKFSPEKRILEFRELCDKLMTDEQQTRDIFYARRAEWNSMRESPGEYFEFSEREVLYYALFMYIQNTAHFGLYRINDKNHYTSTYHFFNKQYKPQQRIDYLVDLTSKLRFITSLNYKEFLENIVYFKKLLFIDPPYVGTNNCGEFLPDDMKWLNDYCAYTAKQGSPSIVCTYQYPEGDTRRWNLEDTMKDAVELYSNMTKAHQKLSDAKNSLKKETVYAIYK